MTELEKCMAGEFYDCHDKVFIEMKSVATRWMQRYNALPYERRPERYQCSGNCSVALARIVPSGMNLSVDSDAISILVIMYRLTIAAH